MVVKDYLFFLKGGGIGQNTVLLPSNTDMAPSAGSMKSDFFLK